MITSHAGVVQQVAGLFTSLHFQSMDPTNTADCARWARQEDPTRGFEPFAYGFNGTETRVRFFGTPESLGDLGALVAPHWPRGAVGLALFFNQELGSLGATFVTTASQCSGSPWAEILEKPWVWQAFGGTMFVLGDFGETLTAHMDKSAAMALKGRFIDMSLTAVGKPETRLGGSKSCYTIFRDGVSVEDATANYALFQRALGINITGGDQGFTARHNAIAIGRAPENFCNSPLTGGYDPTSNTSPGIIEGLRLIIAESFSSPSLFIQGVGGIGHAVARAFIDQGLTVYASDSALTNPHIVEIFGMSSGREGQFVIDMAPRERDFFPTAYESSQGIRNREDFLRFADKQGWKRVSGLVGCLQLFPEADIFVPCASVHPLTQGVRDYLKASRVRLVLGSANNVHGTEDGSYLTSAWALQEAGIIVINDSLANRGGATGVIGKISGLSEEDMERQHRQIAADILEAYRESRRLNVPSQILGDLHAAERSNRGLEEGTTVGARMPLPSTRSGA